MPEFTVHLMGTSYRELRITADTPERARKLAQDDTDLQANERIADIDFYSADEEVETVESYDTSGDRFIVHTHYSRTEEELNK